MVHWDQGVSSLVKASWDEDADASVCKCVVLDTGGQRLAANLGSSVSLHTSNDQVQLQTVLFRDDPTNWIVKGRKSCVVVGK